VTQGEPSLAMRNVLCERGFFLAARYGRSLPGIRSESPSSAAPTGRRDLGRVLASAIRCPASFERVDEDLASGCRRGICSSAEHPTNRPGEAGRLHSVL
jgi:hypothetical protein